MDFAAQRAASKMNDTDMTMWLSPLALPAEALRIVGDDASALRPEIATAIAHAWIHAPYLKGLLRTRRAAVAKLVGQGPAAVVSAAMESARTAPLDDIDDALRRAKGDIALAVAIADLSGLWSLEQVTRALSDFADMALDRAVEAALAERDAPNTGFSVLALGKLGSHELNYSSDVDLILLYDPDVIPVREREDHAEAAARIARRIVQIMEAPTAAGYVFRTDLRLRPMPEATPPALPFHAAESYYQSEALTWERVAFIRARACAGDVLRGEAFLAAIRPFVWRRSLDYTAIRDIQAVSLRIRDHYEAGQAVGPGFDLKRGRGGIREIEFYAQIHQMVWGGRDPGLRTGDTLAALAALARAGRIDAHLADRLGNAYRWLRTAEHRFQMRADEQTHVVPTGAAQRNAATTLSGFTDWPAMERRLKCETQVVADAYDMLITEAGGEHAPTDPAALKAWLKQLGVKPMGLAPLIERWRTGQFRALRSESARAAFEALLPGLLRTLAEAGDPVQAAQRFDTFLTQLPAGLQFFALLQANPRLLPLLGQLLGITPVLANALAREPALIDVLLTDGAFAPLPDADVLLRDLRARAGNGEVEDVLDRVRRWTGEHRFQVGAQLIEAMVDPLIAARSLSDLADAALEVLAATVARAFAVQHGKVPGGELLVLAMGRYGGGRLSHASDLDLVYLFTGDFDAVSDGAKPLAATAYFNRLATRLTAALSAPTAAGALYEVDTRLRPSGTQGLLAISVDSFAKYQREAAWTWEHLALTRARVVAGDAATVTPVIDEILDRPRDAATLRKDVLAMRGDIDAAKPGQGLWDVKLGKGGLIDIEFITHFLQLRDHIARTPDMHDALGVLVANRLVPADLAAAHDLLTRLLVLLRLVVPDTSGKVGQFPAAVAQLLAQATGCDDFAALEDALTQAKRTIVGAWETVFDARR
jgi:[glutamine synthetase] adenylyltransferase / [glutamine synthetase]-adenylyl-L-tyrosine phosphorylase